MGILSSFFDVVAGVSILAGRSSLLDTTLTRIAGRNFTVRGALGLSFLSVGFINLWATSRKQKKIERLTKDAETFAADGAYMRKTKSQVYENEKWGIFWDGNSRYRWYGISLIDNPNDVRIVAEYDANETYPYALAIPRPDEVKHFRTFNELLEHLDNMMERSQIGVFAHGVDGNRMHGRSKYPTVGDWTWYGAEGFGVETFEAPAAVMRTYKGRKSPSISAKSVKVGTRKRGNDGKMWQVRSVKSRGKRTQRWFKD